MPDRRPLIALTCAGLSAHTAASALAALDADYVLVRRDAIREGYLWDHGNGRFIAHDTNRYEARGGRVGIFEMPEEPHA